MSQITIEQGDNLDLLKSYPDNHFDSVVTDAPYGLGKEPDALKLLQDWIDHDYHEVKGKGFMGKNWDAFVPQPIFWKEVFRVLKPGGYLLCFFGTRTYDWGTIAIRLAGFEIRDMITWHYGSGFPKSLDVSKAIDKSAGVEREVVGVKGSMPIQTGGRINAEESAINGSFERKENNITSASSPEAKKYEGWGTALKPATEPICVARKPLCGTVAQNMIVHGTGGINNDGCRIEFKSERDLQSATFGTGTNIIGGNYVGSKSTRGRKNIEANPVGRFPANVILDSFAASLLDIQSGQLTSGKPSGVRKAGNNVYGAFGTGQDITGYGDIGGASRFFYCAKASQDERNAGCEHLNKRQGGMISNTSVQHLTRRDEGGAPDPVSNFHPTVKPISLMRWLQRLVTPVGGLTLDPFAGSGTSGCAASFEGFDIVLMEAEAEYIPIIEARTKHWQKVANRERYIQELKNSQTSLFGEGAA